MDPNDIEQRLRRLYQAVDGLTNFDVEHGVNVAEINGEDESSGGFAISFGNLSKAELENTVMNVIALIAGLKDHTKNHLERQGKDPSMVEEVINRDENLSILMDLHNQDKHGYPLTRTRRSDKDPRIIRVFQALHLRNGPDAKAGSYVKILKSGPKVHGDAAIEICGIVVDREGAHLNNLEDIIESSLIAFGNLITQENVGGTI